MQVQHALNALSELEGSGELSENHNIFRTYTYAIHVS
jgi:hypothetical protein